MTTPLIEPVTGPRTLAYLAHKLGRHRDRALVAVTSDLPVPAHSTRRSVSLADLVQAEEAYWVRLTKQGESFTLPVWDGAARRLWQAQITVSWWADNPHLVAARHLFDCVPLVRRDVETLVHATLTNAHSADRETLEEKLTASLSTPVHLQDIGITYGHGTLLLIEDAVPEERRAQLHDAQWEVAVTEQNHQVQHARLTFYRDLVEQGPTALLAFWLMHRPDDVPRIIEAVQKIAPAPTAGPDPDERHLLALFEGMTGFERQQVRKYTALGLARAGGEPGRALIEELGLLDVVPHQKDAP
jgi:hypothetical protein